MNRPLILIVDGIPVNVTLLGSSLERVPTRISVTGYVPTCYETKKEDLLNID